MTTYIFGIAKNEKMVKVYKTNNINVIKKYISHIDKNRINEFLTDIRLYNKLRIEKNNSLFFVNAIN